MNRDELVEIHKRFEAFYLETYAKLTELVDEVRKAKFQESELVDLGFLCREISNYADELRKECNAKQDLIGKVLALSVAKRSLQGDENNTTRGLLAVGTSDVKVIPVMPKAGTAEYTELCQFFGVPEDLEKAGVIGFSFSKLSDLCADRLSQGLPVPSGIRKTYPQAYTIFRRRNPDGKQEKR